MLTDRLNSEFTTTTYIFAHNLSMTELISKCQAVKCYKLEIQYKSRLLVRYESGRFYIFSVGQTVTLPI